MKTIFSILVIVMVSMPCFGFGKYLDSAMRGWSNEDAVEYFYDRNGMAFYIMYYDEAIWNVC